jgi:hypothetical protein
MADHNSEQNLDDGSDHMPWDDPTKSDEERWEEYRKRYDLIVLPPKSPNDPKEEEYERSPGSFEVPLSKYPGWRMGFVPKGVVRLRPPSIEPSKRD